MISALSYYRLGCLMQEFLPHVLVNHALGVQDFVIKMGAPETAGRQIVMRVLKPDEPIAIDHPEDSEKYMRPIPDELRTAFKQNIQRLLAESIKLQLKATHASLYRMMATLDDPNGLLQALVDDGKEIHGRIVDELKYTTCFALEGKAEQLYRAGQPFGQEVADRFPSTGFDITEAAKCLAFDRATACVFHLMRVLEVGLQALAADLGITKIERNWQQLLQDIDARIRTLPFQTAAEKTRLAERSAAVAHLRNVKDAWRNDVMHPRDVYTVEQATDIFNHTRALMASLATFLTWPAP